MKQGHVVCDAIDEHRARQALGQVPLLGEHQIDGQPVLTSTAQDLQRERQGGPAPGAGLDPPLGARITSPAFFPRRASQEERTSSRNGRDSC